jgi:hypothetical protein
MMPIGTASLSLHNSTSSFISGVSSEVSDPDFIKGGIICYEMPLLVAF